MRVLVVLGTRPEAIKLAPVLRALDAADIDSAVCSTGQHRELLDQALQWLDIRPDFELDLMDAGPSLDRLAAAVTERVGWVIDVVRPDWVIVQGDTTSAYAAAVAARGCRVRLAHVEAGLRTGDLSAPWPEEGNRRAITRLADLHFPPTPLAAENLRAEGVIEGISAVTGNTAVDALLAMMARLDAEPSLRAAAEREIASVTTEKRLIFVTGHRRENHGSGLHRVASALRRIAARGDVEVVLPLHPNPALREFADLLTGQPSIRLLPPLSYPACLLLMRRSTLIITDSGGIQEEAPALGAPVLVTRASTERPEALDAGAALLVGTDETTIVAVVSRLLDNRSAYDAMAQVRMPFGDGHAAKHIVKRLRLEAVRVVSPAEASSN